MVWPILLGLGVAGYAVKKIFEDSDSDHDDEEDDVKGAFEKEREKAVSRAKKEEASVAIRAFLEARGIPKDDKISQQVTPGRVSFTLTGDAYLADCKVRFQKTSSIRQLDSSIERKSIELEKIREAKKSLLKTIAADKKTTKKGMSE